MDGIDLDIDDIITSTPTSGARCNLTSPLILPLSPLIQVEVLEANVEPTNTGGSGDQSRLGVLVDNHHYLSPRAIDPKHGITSQRIPLQIPMNLCACVIIVVCFSSATQKPKARYPC